MVRRKIIERNRISFGGVKISVIVPMYNNSDTVLECVESVFDQSCRPHELILVDDGSTDKTLSLVKKFRRFRDITLVCQSNQGQGSARNTGAKLASGEWLAFLDADDRWLPQKLQLQLDYISNHPEVVLCSTGATVIEGPNDLTEIYPEFLCEDLSIKKQYLNLMFCNTIVNSSVIIKRKTFFQVGGFDESAHMRRVEDYDLWLRVAARNRIGAVNQSLVIYRHPSKENQDIHRIKGGLRQIYLKQLTSSPLIFRYKTSALIQLLNYLI